MPCLSELTLAQFVAGNLSPSELERIDAELDRCADCRRTLVELARSTHSVEHPVGGVDGAPTLAPGDRLGRYDIEGVVGRGGGGVVYRAHDRELDRLVAVKVLHRLGAQRQPGDAHVARTRLRAKSIGDGSAHEGAERLHREAKVMAALSDPHVVTVFEVGEADGNDVYLVMELVEGGSLAECVSPKWSWRDVIDCYLQAARGLSAAHERGIVHGDFKPHNVLVGLDGRCRVTDFGLARMHETPPSSWSPEATERVAAESAIAGTPSYMAPEQLEGKAATAASDQFAFARALYFDAYGLPAAIWRATPSSPATARRSVPGWLWPILRRAMHADPGRRFESVAAMTAAIERGSQRRRRRIMGAVVFAGMIPASLVVGGTIGRHVGASPSALSKSDCMDRAHAFAAPHVAAAPKAAQAIAASEHPHADELAGAVSRHLDAYLGDLGRVTFETCSAKWIEKTRTDELYERQMQCLSGVSLRLETTLQAMTEATDDLAALSPSAVHALPAVASCADAATLLASPGLPADEPNRTEVIAARESLDRARAQRDLAQHDRAIEHAQQALETAKRVGHKATGAQALYLIAEVQGRTASPERAKELLYKAAYAAEAAKDDLTAAQVWVKLVFHTGFRLRQFDEAYRLSDLAAAAIARLGGDRLLEAKRKRAHGVALWAQGKHDEALALLRPALKDTETVLGIDDPDVAANVADIASALSAKGELEEAVEYSLRALDIRERNLGQHHPDLASSHNNLGSQLARLGRSAEAREHLEKALSILEASVGANHIHVAYTLEGIAESDFERGEHAAALATYRRAAAIAEKVQGADHPDVAYSLIGQGRCLRALGRLEEGEAALARALSVLPRDGDPRPIIDARKELAESYAQSGKRGRAKNEMLAVRDALDSLGDEAGRREAQSWIAKL